MALHLNKLDSSSPKDALCQVWLEFDQWFLNFNKVCLLFQYCLSLEKGVALHVKKIESTLPKDALY